MVISFVVKAFLTLFVVIDPIGLAPIFITLAGDRSISEQARISRQAVLVARGIVFAFALGGLLRYLGISIEAFEVAAGNYYLRLRSIWCLRKENAKLMRKKKKHD